MAWGEHIDDHNFNFWVVMGLAGLFGAAALIGSERAKNDVASSAKPTLQDRASVGGCAEGAIKDSNTSGMELELDDGSVCSMTFTPQSN